MTTAFEVNHYCILQNATCQLCDTEKIKTYETKASQICSAYCLGNTQKSLKKGDI